LSTVILGIGNILLGDEGVGVHAVRHFQATMPAADTEFIDGGTLSFTLVETIEAAEKLVVIDAAELHCAPGTVRLFQGEEMDRFVGTSKKSSVHEVSLADLLVISYLTGHLPKYRALIGIQPGMIDWSDELTEPVKQAIPVACEHVLTLIAKWQHLRRRSAPRIHLQPPQRFRRAVPAAAGLPGPTLPPVVS
jgi:hydrogenase maturation protease